MPPTNDFHVHFFGIGGIRCASTWLATCLDEHPDIRLANDKEPNHYVHHLEVFARFPEPNFLRGAAWYRRQFEPAAPHQVLGDFSVKLLHNGETAPGLIHDHHPDAKFVVVLRDPVSRAYSHYWHHKSGTQGAATAPATFAAAIQHEPFVRHSRYHEQLVPWLEAFPRDRFHVILDLDIKSDPLQAVQGTYRHLGVAGDHDPPSLKTRPNKPSARRGIATTVGRFTRPLRRIGMGPLLDLAGKAGARRIQDRLDRKAITVPPIDPRDAERLRDMLLSDIEALERDLDRDLSPWKGNRP